MVEVGRKGDGMSSGDPVEGADGDNLLLLLLCFAVRLTYSVVLLAQTARSEWPGGVLCSRVVRADEEDTRTGGDNLANSVDVEGGEKRGRTVHRL